MKRTLLFATAAVVAVALAATAALAQLDEESFSLDERYERDIVTVEPSISSERIYVVEEGDTLWDIADLLFQDPWYWPTLWAYNPQITNPHWIFPGDYIYVRPKVDSTPKEQLTLEGSRYATGPKDVLILARRKGFIPVQRYRESGVIEASREEKTLLGALDEIYIRFSTVKKIRPDQKYTIYRVEEEIEHPVTGDTLGYKVNFLGQSNILSTDKPLVSAVIIESFEEIERGDRLTTGIEHVSRLIPRRNEVDLDGVIAAFFHDASMAGEHEYVFIDRGKEDGVKRGNRFIVMGRGDGYEDDQDEDDLEDYPWENIGEAMVVEAHETTCLAVLTGSIRELRRGMPVRMLKGY